MKKSKTVKLNNYINFPIALPETYFQSIEKKIGKRLSNALYKQTNDALADIRHHFGKDKWNLDFGVMSSELVGRVFGDIEWYLASRILHSGYKVGSKKNKQGKTELMVSKK